MSQTREKMETVVLTRPDFLMIGRSTGIPIFFCIEPTLRKNNLIRTTERYLITALLRPFSAITTHSDNRFFKDTLQLKI